MAAGRDTAFATGYSVRHGKADEVLEYVGDAPFGFGYRRCPGELLTVEVIEDFLRRIRREGIRFEKISIDTDSATVSTDCMIAAQPPVGMGSTR